MDAVHIVGAGGIGSCVAYSFRVAQLPVVLVETNTQKLANGLANGIRVDRRPALHAEFVHFNDWRPKPNSWILLCTKCYDNAAILERLTVPVRLLPIQNGFDPRLESFGHEFEGIASFVAESESNTLNTRVTRAGKLHLGRKKPGTTSDSELLAIASRLSMSRLFSVEVVPRIDPYKHSKLMYNAAISPLAAASGIDNGQLLSLAAARRWFFALIQENYRILSGAGIELGKVGPFHPATVAWILRQKWLSAALARLFEPSLRGTYCSMAGEIQKGRTEIDNYNGYLLKLAAKTGTPAPFNQAIYELVTRMTANGTIPDLQVLASLTFQELATGTAQAIH